ncbi:MAG: CDP-alcohol phosphatidyltransferase family protein [Pyrinomonadaceae bacterium]|nr:CDP-alcohol phosphatidyltransferase family protein [Pyrinomonadaceae bacterium]MBP6214017.1 CDP-alcohol phosphatidyltransferase family protein [Pyrinomonadaceae bacterium]
MEDEKDNRPPHRGIKKGLYVIPTLFTAANVGMGFLAVLWSIRGYHAAVLDPASAAVYFDHSAIAIGLAILFDTLDGRVARATRTATEIGVQFDSLADVLTFGIAPTALVYAWAVAPTFAESSPTHNIGVLLLFMYLMCGAFRLARFNLQATRPRVLMEGTAKVDKKNFVGLPIPPAGGLLAAIVHFSPAPLNFYGADASRYYAIAVFGLIAILSVLMVSKIRYSSMKTLGSRRTNFMMLLGLVAIGMAVWLYSAYALLVISVIYVGHGLVWWVARSLFSKRSEA